MLILTLQYHLLSHPGKIPCIVKCCVSFRIHPYSIIIRTMQTIFKAATKAATKIPPASIQVRHASYRVDDVEVKNTTVDQSSVNPLLVKYNGDVYQHPAYIRSLCDEPNCEYRLCPKPCSKVLEEADVGHATHSGSYPKTVYISQTDSSGNPRPEYMLPYENPIENTTYGKNKNEDKTEKLNSNKEAINNVHMNSSKNSTKKGFNGSDDPTNIN